ncbi:MAG: hypothetical protein KGL39_40350 [Patescibacteria group bacterium]|nr:hypothetical protein [Patescibacteria group bacterium]
MSRIAEAFDASPYRDGIPGRKEETTSRLAAERFASTADTLRSLVLSAIAAEPRTADEVAEALGQTVLAIRPRVSELRKLNKVRPLFGPDGRQVRRANASGINAIVWEPVR